MVIFPIIWVLFGIAAAMAAANRGHSGCGWLLLGFLLGPFGLLFALLSTPKPSIEPADVIHSLDFSPSAYRHLDEETKKCPHCAEIIKLAARKCRFCGEVFGPLEVADQISRRQAEIADELEKLRAGGLYCPACRKWDVHQAFLPDGSFGPWCPYCKKPVKS